MRGKSDVAVSIVIDRQWIPTCYKNPYSDIKFTIEHKKRVFDVLLADPAFLGYFLFLVRIINIKCL